MKSSVIVNVRCDCFFTDVSLFLRKSCVSPALEFPFPDAAPIVPNSDQLSQAKRFECNRLAGEAVETAGASGLPRELTLNQ